MSDAGQQDVTEVGGQHCATSDVSASPPAGVGHKPGTPHDLDALERMVDGYGVMTRAESLALIERVRVLERERFYLEKLTTRLRSSSEAAERERDELREAVKGVMELPRADVKGQEQFAEGYNLALYNVAMYSLHVTTST